MWSCGIDWAEKHLDFCLQNSSGDVVCRSRIDNTEDGFLTLLDAFSKRDIDTKEIAVAIESPHEPIVDFLLVHGIRVYPVNPTAIHQYRKSLKVSGSKSDTADAELIASYLRLHHQVLRVWQVPSQKLRQLQLLVTDRDKLVKEKVLLQNQMRMTLRGYFPQALAAFSSLTCPTALDFLCQYPNFAATREKTQAHWQQFLDAHRVFNPSARRRLLSALQHKMTRAQRPVIEAKSMLTAALVGQLKPLMAALGAYEKRIKALLSQFDEGDRFRSLPGVDVILAAKLLAAIGTDRQRFDSANEMQRFFGTAPYTKSSGQQRSVHFRRACHKGMRQTLQQMAFASLQKSPWASGYFQKKRKEGKRKHYALRCLANLWLKVIFAIWKTETPYDENQHLASITRHQLSQVG